MIAFASSAVRGSRLRLWVVGLAVAASMAALLWVGWTASAGLMGGAGLRPSSAVAAHPRSDETAQLVAKYQRDFARAWAEEAQGRRTEEGGPVEAAMAPALTGGPSSPLLPAASHPAKRKDGGLSAAASPPPATSRPSFAVAVLMSLTAELCRAAWLQFRSLHRLHPWQVDYLVVYATTDEAEEWRAITTDPFCRLLYAHSHQFFDSSAAASSAPAPAPAAPVGRVRFFPVQAVQLPWWNAPRFERWAYSYNKLPLFGAAEYAKLLYFDVDVLVVAPLSAFFQLPFHVAAGLDTAQSCRKAQTKLNAGVLLLTPSPHLFSAFHAALHTRDFSCVTGQLAEVEQELLNCICGYGQGGRAVLPMRPDVQCGVLPYYANVVPSYAACDEYAADEVLLLHFADVPKPWQPSSAAFAAPCRALAVNATWDREWGWFEAEERRRCFTGEAAAFTFYHCLQGGDEDSRRLRIDRDCRLVSLDQKRERG